MASSVPRALAARGRYKAELPPPEAGSQEGDRQLTGSFTLTVRVTLPQPVPWAADLHGIAPMADADRSRSDSARRRTSGPSARRVRTAHARHRSRHGTHLLCSACHRWWA